VGQSRRPGDGHGSDPIQPNRTRSDRQPATRAARLSLNSDTLRLPPPPPCSVSPAASHSATAARAVPPATQTTAFSCRPHPQCPLLRTHRPSPRPAPTRIPRPRPPMTRTAVCSSCPAGKAPCTPQSKAPAFCCLPPDGGEMRRAQVVAGGAARGGDRGARGAIRPTA
jgi:hypothetical protein